VIGAGQALVHDLAAAPGHRLHLGIQVVLQHPHALIAPGNRVRAGVHGQFAHRVVELIEILEQHAKLRGFSADGAFTPRAS
tara:strand:+ start:32241 stop:32483 length:243 start_codon:yes stop_codon:yes gene_type:complete